MTLLAVPVLELVVLVWVAHRIGGWTVLLLLASAVLGVVVLRHGGPSTFRRVREATRAGRPPTVELADAFLTVLGGVLLIVPGFVTDVVGLACLVPPFRWGARALLLRILGRAVSRGSVTLRTTGHRVVPGSVVDGGFVPGRTANGAGDGGTPPALEGRVVPGTAPGDSGQGSPGDSKDTRHGNGSHHGNGRDHGYRGDGSTGGGSDDDDRPRRGG
ncbi:MAG: FxsA family protein [Actinomycetes bacterium]